MNAATTGASGIANGAGLSSDLADTGLLTVFCHAQASRAADPLIHDPWAENIAERLAPELATSPKPFLRRLAKTEVRGDLVAHIAIRARKYDQYARDLLARHPGARVVNLGCGLDTRFWRIDDGSCRLLDVDLPDVIALKRALVDESDRYEMIGSSVLDHRWMDRVAGSPMDRAAASPTDRVAASREDPCLFLAEGLFMYLPAPGVKALVLALRSRFPGSELVFETVNGAWLRPWLKWMIDYKMQRQLGLGKGTTYRFGIASGRELESWSPGIRLLEEWSYLDESEPRIGPIRHFRRWRWIRCTQWTVRYLLGNAHASASGEEPILRRE